MRTLKLTIFAFLAAMLVISISIGGNLHADLTASAKAQADPPPFQAFLPMIFQPSYSFFPLIFNQIPYSGPMGPYGGSITALAADPTNQNVLYAGSWGDGVYKSYEGGRVWLPSRNGLTNLYIDSLAIDPTRPNIVYAGTQEGGIFKSTDSGQHWTDINHGIQSYADVYSLAVNNANPNMVYAGTRDGRTPLDGPWGGILYRTTDGGANWSPVVQNLGGSGTQDWVYSLAVDPNSPATVYAAMHISGPYRSDDYGATWKAIGTGITDSSGRAIAVDPRPDHSGTVYYGSWHWQGIYKTNNKGANWTYMGPTHDQPKIYPNGIVVAPSNPDTVLAAENSGRLGVLRSTNGGAWNSIGLKNQLVYSVAVNLLDANTIFAGVYGNGMYQTTDGGSSWGRSQTGVLNTQVTGMVFTGDAKLFASTAGGGVSVSTDGGETWTESNDGLDNLVVNSLMIDPSNPDKLFAATEGGLYTLTTNFNKGTWKKVSAGLPASLALNLASGFQSSYGPGHPFDRGEPAEEMALTSGDLSAASTPVDGAIVCLAFAPSEASVVYAGTDSSGVFASSDGGSTWTAAGLPGATIWGISVQPGDPRVIFAAQKGSASVAVSADGGKTWSDIGQPDAQTHAIYALLQTPTEAGTVYAGTDAGIWKHTASGWTRAGLANSSVPVLAVSGAGALQRIYAGTTNGAYLSGDGGASWQAASPNLAGSTIQSINFDPREPGSVYFGTTVHGAYHVVVR